MKKILAIMISLSLVIMLAYQSPLEVQAAYDNYNWFTMLRVDESQARSVVDAMRKYACTLEVSYADTNRTIADLMEYFIFNSSIAPYNSSHNYYPDYEMTSFSDGEISSTFNSSRQCYACANYMESAVYGKHGLRNTAESIPNSKSAEDLKTFFLTYVQPGEHLLWSYQHSATFVLASADGFYYLQRLDGGEVVLSYFTYEDMSIMLIEKNVDFYVYNACPGVNTILPSFSANVQEGILTVESIDYPCNFYVTAGFEKDDMQTLRDTSLEGGSVVAAREMFDIEENFRMCPFSGQILYYQVFFECLGKQYHTQILETIYNGKSIIANIETEEKVEKSTENFQVVERYPFLTENQVTKQEEKPIVKNTPTYGAWSDWQETPIQGTATLEVEKKTVDETVVTGTHKEFNYSYYSYMNNGTKYYTWSRDYAMKMGGNGERVYRGWGKELMLHTLYDGYEWGSQYVDGGIWFFEEVREVEDTKVVTKDYYRSRIVTY